MLSQVTHTVVSFDLKIPTPDPSSNPDPSVPNPSTTLASLLLWVAAPHDCSLAGVVCHSDDGPPGLLYKVPNTKLLHNAARNEKDTSNTPREKEKWEKEKTKHVTSCLKSLYTDILCIIQHFCKKRNCKKKNCFNNHVHNNQGMGMDSGRYPYDITLLLNNNLDWQVTVAW